MAGAYLERDKKKSRETLDKVYELFPVLKERSKQISGTLSGGEQQMLAIGRALMSEPKLLCIDEPSTGLAPMMRREVFEKIIQIKSLGITILLVEQEVRTVFKMADTKLRPYPRGRSSPRDRAKNCWETRSSARLTWDFNKLQLLNSVKRQIVPELLAK